MEVALLSGAEWSNFERKYPTSIPLQNKTKYSQR